MLRVTYCLLKVILLLLVCEMIGGNQTLKSMQMMPASLPLATPAQLADGGGPMPPPIPLAVPQPAQLADGGGPMPPPIPLAVPQPAQLADGGGPMPPPIPLSIGDSLGTILARFA